MLTDWVRFVRSDENQSRAVPCISWCFEPSQSQRITSGLHGSSGNVRAQSSWLAEPLWTDPGIKSGISVSKLISIFFFFFNSAGWEWMAEHSPQILRGEEKAIIYLNKGRTKTVQILFLYHRLPSHFSAVCYLPVRSSKQQQQQQNN